MVKNIGPVFAIAAALSHLGFSSLAYAATGADYGTRSPRTCAPIRTQPSTKQMVTLVQCSSEEYLDGYIALTDQVKVQPGRARAYDPRTDANHQGIDVKAEVIPIRGSQNDYVCEPVTGLARTKTGRNCSIFVARHSLGTCWRSKSGRWQCEMGQITGTPAAVNQPPPKF